MMEQYFQVLPFFLTAVSIGIVANFLFLSKDVEFTKMRIVREIFGGLWISAAVYILLDQLTTLSDPVLFVITSFAGLVNSKVISFIGHDLIEALGKGVVRGIRNFADRIKSNESDYNNYDVVDEEHVQE